MRSCWREFSVLPLLVLSGMEGWWSGEAVWERVEQRKRSSHEGVTTGGAFRGGGGGKTWFLITIALSAGSHGGLDIIDEWM